MRLRTRSEACSWDSPELAAWRVAIRYASSALTCSCSTRHGRLDSTAAVLAISKSVFGGILFIRAAARAFDSGESGPHRASYLSQTGYYSTPSGRGSRADTTLIPAGTQYGA